MKRAESEADTSSRPKRPKRRRRAPSDPLKPVNAKSDEDFIRDHVQPSDGWTSWKHPQNQSEYSITLKQAGVLTPEEFQACFDLLERTSSDDYRASNKGWDPKAKQSEMRSPELRYVLVNNDEGLLRGFTSMMPTWESGKPVVYCYEIHLEDELHGTGLSTQLIGVLESVAKNTPPIEKIMLTVYVRNKRARAFYAKRGFVRDETSPEELRLRNGRIVVPDYEILSRVVVRDSEAQPQTLATQSAEGTPVDAAKAA